MNPIKSKLAVVAICCAGLSMASCTSDKPAGEGTTTVAIAPGEAGGIIEETFTTSATVNVIDPSTRVIHLTAQDGSGANFKAGPEVRNFDQIRVGDKITATIVERLVIFVRRGDVEPTVAHAAALAAAPKGAKPGALVGEAYEITAKIKTIDTVGRTAVLEFPDGQTKTVAVRPDVDMMRYKVGDTVVIRVSAALSVIVAKP